MSAEEIGTLQVITGLDGDAALALLISADNNLELAIARHFDGPNAVVDPAPGAPVPIIERPPPPIDNDDDRYLVEPNVSVIDKHSGDVVPLEGVKVAARINQFVGEVALSLRFVNSHATNPLEAVFQLADEGIIVHDFEVQVGDKITKGECVEKEEAFARYDDAISSGQSAFLAEKKGKRKTFDISAGNLAPGMSCIVNIHYLMSVDTLGDEFVFGLPVTRTVPPKESRAANAVPIQNDLDMKAQVPDGLSMVLAMNQIQRIVDVRCISNHAVQIEKTDLTANVTLSDAHLSPQRFELQFSLSDPHQTVCSIEKCEEILKKDTSKSIDNSKSGDNAMELVVEHEVDPVSGAVKPIYNKYALGLSVVPQIKAEDIDVRSEMIFIVDCSGSMAGGRMRRAKNALQLFLRALPETTKFNIVAFGDRYTKLFPATRPYDAQSLEAANEYVNSLDSKMGGTDLLGPISEVMNQPVEAGYPRQIFLLTDGDVKDKSSILHYIRENIGSNTRVFAFGIGNEVSQALMTGIAKFGRGKAEFVESGTSLEAPVMRQVQRALQPVLSNFKVDWGTLKAPNRAVEYQFNPVFDGQRVDFYSFFEGPFDHMSGTLANGGRHEIKITAYAEDMQFEFPCVVDLNQVKSESLVQRLAAYHEISDMENSANRAGYKGKIIDLALKYHLASKYTSFIAITSSEEARAAEGAMMRMDVDEAIADKKSDRSILDSAGESMKRFGGKVSDLLHRSGQFVTQQLDTLASHEPFAAGYGAAPRDDDDAFGYDGEPAVGRRSSQRGRHHPVQQPGQQQQHYQQHYQQQHQQYQHQVREKQLLQDSPEFYASRNLASAEPMWDQQEEESFGGHSSEDEDDWEAAPEDLMIAAEPVEYTPKGYSSASLSYPSPAAPPAADVNSPAPPPPPVTTSWTDQVANFGSSVVNKMEIFFNNDEQDEENAAPLKRKSTSRLGGSTAAAAPAEKSKKLKESSKRSPSKPSPCKDARKEARDEREFEISADDEIMEEASVSKPSSLSIASVSESRAAPAAGMVSRGGFGGGGALGHGGPALSRARAAPPSKPISAPIPTQPAATAIELLVHVNANGSFDLNASLAALLGTTLSQLLDKMPEPLNKHTELWATALVLATLEVKFATSKDEWSLVHSKARKYLARTLKSDNIDLTVDSVIESAKSAF